MPVTRELQELHTVLVPESPADGRTEHVPFPAAVDRPADAVVGIPADAVLYLHNLPDAAAVGVEERHTAAVAGNRLAVAAGVEERHIAAGVGSRRRRTGLGRSNPAGLVGSRLVVRRCRIAGLVDSWRRCCRSTRWKTWCEMVV